MRERVFVRRGKTPVIIVAPHGADDTATTTVTKKAADLLDCNAVINQGFERCDIPDIANDHADCNRVDHIKLPVIFDEFLKPIISIRDAHIRKLSSNPSSLIGTSWGWSSSSSAPNPDALLILHVHGVGNAIHKEANEQVAAVVGYGLGHTKHSLTCQEWRKNLFVDLMRKCVPSGEIYEGKGGGKYAGRQSNNLNQYFRKHEDDAMVDSLQIEFPFSMRHPIDTAEKTGALLAVVVAKMLKHTSYSNVPPPKLI